MDDFFAGAGFDEFGFGVAEIEGGAEQSNYFDYPLLTIEEMPEVVPIILPSDRPPQGVGEVVLAPLAPAIAQALLSATGHRIDVMPFPAAVFQANPRT